MRPLCCGSPLLQEHAHMHGVGWKCQPASRPRARDRHCFHACGWRAQMTCLKQWELVVCMRACAHPGIIKILTMHAQRSQQPSGAVVSWNSTPAGRCIHAWTGWITIANQLADMLCWPCICAWHRPCMACLHGRSGLRCLYAGMYICAC